LQIRVFRVRGADSYPGLLVHLAESATLADSLPPCQPQKLHVAAQLPVGCLPVIVR